MIGKFTSFPQNRKISILANSGHRLFSLKFSKNGFIIRSEFYDAILHALIFGHFGDILALVIDGGFTGQNFLKFLVGKLVTLLSFSGILPKRQEHT